MYPYAPYARLHGTPSATFEATQAGKTAREAEKAKNPYYGYTIIYVTDRLYNSPEYQQAVKAQDKNQAIELIVKNSAFAVMDDIINAPEGGTLRKEAIKVLMNKEPSKTLEGKIVRELSQNSNRSKLLNAYLKGEFIPKDIIDDSMRVLCLKSTDSSDFIGDIQRIINLGNLGEYPMIYPDTLSSIVVTPIKDEIRILRSRDTTASSEEEEQSFLMRNKVWIGLGVGALIAVGIYHSRSK